MIPLRFLEHRALLEPVEGPCPPDLLENWTEVCYVFLTMPRATKIQPSRNSSRRNPKHPSGRADPVQLSVLGSEIVVWCEFPGRRRKRIGAVNRELVADASRHGQDLVGGLVEMALKEADCNELLRCDRA